jgi:hypothetical protein
VTETQERLFDVPDMEPMQIGDDWYVMVLVREHWRRVKVKGPQTNGS